MPLDNRQKQVVQDIRVLWPYLTFHERLDWVARLRGWFDDDFTETVLALSAVSA